MESVYIVLMAAYESKGMNSAVPKILHKICGKTILEHMLDTSTEVSDNKPILVIDPTQAEAASAFAERAQIIIQTEQKGTGSAMQAAAEYLSGREGYVIVMPADIPLIKAETLLKLVQYTASYNLSACVLSANCDDPAGYGRLIEAPQGGILKIIEDKELSDAQRMIKKINTGIMCFNIKTILEVIWGLSDNNSRKQYYLTDCIESVGRIGSTDNMEINTDEYKRIINRLDLADAQREVRRNIINEIILSGVTVMDPDSTYIDKGVKVGMDTIIYPNNYLEGNTQIGGNCILYPNNRLVDCSVGSGVTMQGVVATEATICNSVKLGPYTHLRPHTILHDRTFAGAFVEMKNADFGEGSKSAHLSYVGDAKIGSGVNIGCGVVFVNYDGKHKHMSTVGNNAFIGSNSNLISPVTVGDDGFVAAGSTITEDVPAGALCIARSRQTIKEDWVIKKKQREENQ